MFSIFTVYLWTTCILLSCFRTFESLRVKFLTYFLSILRIKCHCILSKRLISFNVYVPISSNLYWFRNWKKTWNASRQSIENRKSVQVSGCDCSGFNFRQSSELVQLFQRVDDGLAFLQVGDLGANLAGGHFVIQALQINGEKTYAA